tara:strand:+ start:581 stop:838 length:258 start_codon:yes stop_codon:yes gene_type:complete
MLIFADSEETKAIQVMLQFLAEKVSNHWQSMDDVDYEKPEYRELRELLSYLKTHGVDVLEYGNYVCKGRVDVVSILYKLSNSDIY